MVNVIILKVLFEIVSINDGGNIIGICIINENDGTLCTLCKLYVYQRSVFTRASNDSSFFFFRWMY